MCRAIAQRRIHFITAQPQCRLIEHRLPLRERQRNDCISPASPIRTLSFFRPVTSRTSGRQVFRLPSPTARLVQLFQTHKYSLGVLVVNSWLAALSNLSS